MTKESLLTKIWANKVVTQSLQINALRVFSLGIGFVGSIWSSRCLGPEKLGISGMVIGAITPLVLLINLNQTPHFVRLYRAQALESDRAELVSIISTYKVVACLALMTLAVPIILLGHFSLPWHLALAAAFPFFFLTANAADWLLQSEEKTPAVTLAMAAQALITTALYFIFVRPGVSAGTDLVIQNIGLIAATGLAWFWALNNRKIRLFNWEKLKLIVPILSEGRWLIATGFAVYVFTSLEVPLIGWLYSLKELGIYRTSIALVAGLQAFTNYIPMLLYPRMIDWNKQGAGYLWKRQREVLFYFAIFTLCVSSAAFLLAPIGYHYIYGPPFQKGAYPFAILFTSKLLAVINGILSWGLMAQKKDRSLFNIMIIVSFFSLASNLIAIPRFGAYGASTINLLSEVLMQILIVTFIRRSLKNG